MINVCTEQKQGILCKMHCCYQHSLSLILGCSAQSTSAFPDFVSRDYSCCWPGTQRGMHGEHAYGLSYCLLLFCPLQGNSLPTQQTAMDQKEPLCIRKLIPISYSHHVMCSAGSVLWFEEILIGSSPHFLTRLIWQLSLISVYRSCLPLLSKAPPIC